MMAPKEVKIDITTFIFIILTDFVMFNKLYVFNFNNMITAALIN